VAVQGRLQAVISLRKGEDFSDGINLIISMFVDQEGPLNFVAWARFTKSWAEIHQDRACRIAPKIQRYISKLTNTNTQLLRIRCYSIIPCTIRDPFKWKPSPSHSLFLA
jgi:hypothetical protein